MSEQNICGREVFDTQAHYYPSDTLSLDELAHWIAFSRTLGIGPVRFRLLLSYFEGDVEAAWKADSKELAQAGLDEKIIHAFLKQRATIIPHHELERMEKLKI